MTLDLFAQGRPPPPKRTEIATDLYRYLLIDPVHPGVSPPILWCMLNPSTAGAERNDPTLDRVLGFSRRWGFGDVLIVNLFAFRSSKPAEVVSALKNGIDVVGPDNDQHLEDAAEQVAKAGGRIMAGWGASSLAFRGGREQAVLSKVLRPRGDVWCLAENPDESPRHPLARGVLRVPDDVKPSIWRHRKI